MPPREPRGGATADRVNDANPERYGTSLTDHLGLFLTGAAAFLAAIRLMAAANLDPVTAMAILQNIGVANAVVGTFVALLPVLALVAFVVVLAVRFGKTGRRRGRTNGILDAALFMLATTCFYITPWTHIVLAGLALCFVLAKAIARFVWRRHRLRAVWAKSRGSHYRVASRVFEKLGTAYLAALLVMIVLDTQPWFAPEVIRTQDETMIGYVLRADSEGIVVLRQDLGRAVVYVSGEAERTVCRRRVSAFDGRSLFQVLVPPPTVYRPCPEE